MASKYLDVDEMGVLAQAGIRLVGENRAEGLETKWGRWKDAFEFHFIGHLQSRKVRQVLPYVSLDPLGRVHLAGGGVGQEGGDGGAGAPGGQREWGRNQVWYPPGGRGDLSGAGGGPSEGQVRGPDDHGSADAGPGVHPPFFRELRELRDRLAVAFAGRYELTELSMGMSNDYEVAVEEGATIVRMGSALLSDA